jgi:hypothetical protein
VKSPVQVLSRSQVRPRYYVQVGSMRDNPYGVPPATIDEMEETGAPETVAQVVYGVFVEASGLVFHAKAVTNLFFGEELNVERWEKPGLMVPSAKASDYGLPLGRKYAIGVDLARKTDFTVILVFDTTYCPSKPAQCVYYHRLNRVSWEEIYREIARAAVRFQAEALLDASGMGGDVVLNELDGRFYCPHCDTTVPFSLTDGACLCPKCRREGKRFQVGGKVFGGQSKEQAITNLQQVMVFGEGLMKEWGLMRMPRIRQVQDELAFYRLDDKKLVTDTVMALALVAEQLDFEQGGFAAGSIHGGN